MAEIKLNPGFYNELEAFRSAGNALNSAGISSNVTCTADLSLSTVEAYLERLLKIQDLLPKFQSYIENDAADMKAHADELEAADNSQ